ncbi:kinetochore Nuf2 isoform X1 [Labeo rohita]|uniref:Kinetochore Nuf2 isoform X1 n=1 Tax=Labeo rohita TaxID=84645 RepID=A0A498NJJ4_LABRO|nr:kinetochore Nuf2 isoform X1 [Labeo rohita]
MNENTFPVYKVDAIVQFYRTEVLTGQEAKHFTKNDITPVPKPESIQRLYMRVLQLLFRFRPECHYTVPLSENVQYPMLYEWVTPIMSVYMRITIPPEQQAEAKELAAALAELTTNTQHEYQDVSAMNEKVAQCKTEIAEISQKLTQRKVDVATLKDEIAKLKSQIVESPEELKNEMERMKENVKSIRMSKELADERLVELQMLVQCASQVEAEIQVLLKQLQDLQSSMCKTNQQKEEVQTLAAMNETLQKELKSLSNEEAQLKRALAMKLDKESKQQIRRQKKKEEFYDRLLTTLEQYNKRIESIVVETNADTLKMKSHF